MVAFFKTYTGHLVACIGGSSLSAAVLIYGLVTGKALPTSLGFGVCIGLQVLTTFRVRNEEIRRRRIVENLMEDDKREYLRSVKDLQERLEHALENLDGCPQLILHYEPRKLYDGLCVRNLGVSAASKVRLQQVESGNLLLTSDELSLVAGGPNCGPDGLVPLRLNANPKDPRQRTYHDTEAFEAFIDDREAPRLPSVTELNPVTEENAKRVRQDVGHFGNLNHHLL